jgi:hypothetical protein
MVIIHEASSHQTGAMRGLHGSAPSKLYQTLAMRHGHRQHRTRHSLK